MKLAKKVLVFVVALALMSTVAFTAFAADPAISVSSKTVDEGAKVEVTVGMSGIKGMLSAALLITYDSSKLEYVEQSTSIAGASAQGGQRPGTDNQATVAIAYSDEATVDSITAVTLTFKAIGAAGTTAEVKAEIMDGDIDGIAEPAAATGTVTIAAKATTTTPPATEATTAAPETTKPAKEIAKTGDAGVAVAAALVVLAGAAFVASKKTK